MSPTPSGPPAQDELEVSVFGPGVGESIAVHLGDGRWMIVDSCVDHETGNPAALDYLDRIGVDAATSVELLIVTHWHDDHTKGAVQILERAPRAELVCSFALSSKEFITVLKAARKPFMRPSGVDEFIDLLLVLHKRSGGRRVGIGPRWVAADQCVFRSALCTVHTLSPSSSTLNRSLHELASLMPVPGAPRRRAVAHRPNEVAVVLWVEFGDIRVLLGADLETGRDSRTGWQAVVNSKTRPPGRAQVFKVPHHGSDDAHEERVWTEILAPSPIVLVTPFRGKNPPLPTPTDVERMNNHTSQLYCSAPPLGNKPTISRTVDRSVREVASNVRMLHGGMGQVRLRWPAGADFLLDLVGPAYRMPMR